MSIPEHPVEGFAIIPNWMARDGGISPAAKAVYVNLSSRCGREGACWPSQQTIASETGYGVRRVKDAVAELVSLGVVKVRVEKTPRGRRNHYSLKVGVGQPAARRVGHSRG